MNDWFLIGSGVRQGCMVACDLFLTPVDWLLNRTDYCVFLGTTIGTEFFTDLDFADDVALLTEMLSLLILALEIISHEANFLVLQVNWCKTKIQTTDSSFSQGYMCPWLVTMLKSLSPVHILVLTQGPPSMISGNALQYTKLCVFLRLALFHHSCYKTTIILILHPSCILP